MKSDQPTAEQRAAVLRELLTYLKQAVSDPMELDLIELRIAEFASLSGLPVAPVHANPEDGEHEALRRYAAMKRRAYEDALLWDHDDVLPWALPPHRL
jgi:hypothetical protein